MNMILNQSFFSKNIKNISINEWFEDLYLLVIII